jgi:hypothetical protein
MTAGAVCTIRGALHDFVIFLVSTFSPFSSGQPTDQWVNPAPTSTASNHSSPWSSPAMGMSTNDTQSSQGFDAFAPQPQPNNSLDDAFDMLSSRPTGSATTTGKSAASLH